MAYVDSILSRRECRDSCLIDVLGELGRYVANNPCTCSIATQRSSRVRARSLHSDRVFASISVATQPSSVAMQRTSRVRALSLRSDRAAYVLGRYVATESLPRAWSLRSDRAMCVLGRCVATKLCACSVVTQRPSFGLCVADLDTCPLFLTIGTQWFD